MRPSIIFCIPPVTGHTRRSRVCRVPKISPPPEIAAKPAMAAASSWFWSCCCIFRILALVSCHVHETNKFTTKKKQVLINYKVLPYDQEPRSGSYWPSARVVLWVHARMMVDAAKKRKTEPRKEEEIKVQSSTTRPRPGRILNYMHWAMFSCRRWVGRAGQWPQFILVFFFFVETATALQICGCQSITRHQYQFEKSWTESNDQCL